MVKFVLGVLLLALVVCISRTSAVMVNDTQLEILQAVADDWPVLKRILHDGVWNVSNLDDACTIGRVIGIEECDSDGWVTRFSISNVGLGVMAPAFANMSRLVALSLRNSVYGLLEPTWGQLTKLQTLNLVANTGLNGSIPDAWSSLSSLTDLTIQYGYTMKGPIPSWINMYWPNLKSLVLDSIGLNGSLSDSQLASHPSLTSIHLPSNHLSGPLPIEFSNNPRLEHLNLFSNDLTNEIPSDWSSASFLKTIDLRSNDFNGSIPTQLPSSLTHALLSNNAFSGNVEQSVFEGGNLNLFAIDSNSLSGSIPFPSTTTSPLKTYLLNDNHFSGSLSPLLWKFGALENVWAQNNQIDGSLPNDIDSSCRLVDVDLAGNSITGSISSNIHHCTQLNSLNLNHNILQGALPSGLATLVSIGHLDLSYNQLSNDLPSNWSSESLYHLDLSNNRLTGQIPVSLLALSFHQLTDFYLNNNQFSLCSNSDMTNKTIATSAVCRADLQNPVECGCRDLWNECFQVEMEETCPPSSAPTSPNDQNGPTTPGEPTGESSSLRQISLQITISIVLSTLAALGS
jgi:hypothetical protein